MPRNLAPSKAADRLLAVTGMTEEALDLVARQAGLTVDELRAGGWHPYLILLIHLHAAMLTCHLCGLPASMVRDTLRDILPDIARACAAHVQLHSGLGPLAGPLDDADPGAAEIILPPQYHG